MYVYFYVCVYVSAYVSVYVYTYVCVYANVCVYKSGRSCKHTDHQGTIKTKLGTLHLAHNDA